MTAVAMATATPEGSLQHLDPLHQHNRPGPVRGSNREIQAERHLHQIDGFHTDEGLERNSEKQESKRTIRLAAVYSRKSGRWEGRVRVKRPVTFFHRKKSHASNNPG
ncbi:MAG: hypothetical protein A2X81_03770 [Desulfobacterales bacterium GWB2_56_26]|nr:MAG: hypothetical protein A2X81_03770 [Desulfobacterales bacterium GWB2_56_26]